MQISWNWLSEFVSLQGIRPQDLLKRLTIATAYVERLEKVGSELKKIVAGRLLEVRATEEKTAFCKVDVGGEILVSVCNAPNARPGLMTAVCLPGGAFRGQAEVIPGTSSGARSECVLLNAQQLGLAGMADGIVELEAGLAAGTDLIEHGGLHDTILHVKNKSLTHRPDLWGHYGFAREISALYGRELLPLDVESREQLKGDRRDLPELDIEVRAGCHRYCAARFALRDARENGQPPAGRIVTPLRLQARLRYCGERPRNLLVDLTNYVMLETGQPMHAFDGRHAGRIRVDTLSQPRRFRTLDGEEREIPSGTLMIFDDEEPIGVAGVIGGEVSEIRDDTDEVVLECATFDAVTIRRGAEGVLHEKTQASRRYEKCLPLQGSMLGLRRYLTLLRRLRPDLELRSRIADVGGAALRARKVSTSVHFFRRRIGDEDLSEKEVEKVLCSLGFGVSGHPTLEVEIPEHRGPLDIQTQDDLVDEVARIRGYDKILPRSPRAALHLSQENPEWWLSVAIKQLMAQRFGFHELQTYPWLDEELCQAIGFEPKHALRLATPMRHGVDRMRHELALSLLGACRDNAGRETEIRLLELGPVYQAQGQHRTREPRRLALLLAREGAGLERDREVWLKLKDAIETLGTWLRKSDFALAPAAIPREFPWIHPGACFDIGIGATVIGYLALIDPQVRRSIAPGHGIAVAEIDLAPLLIGSESPILKGPPRFQTAERSINVRLQRDQSYARLEQSFVGFCHKHLLEIGFQDVYEGIKLPVGIRLVTLKLTCGSPTGTLTREEIQSVETAFQSHLESMGFEMG